MNAVVSSEPQLPCAGSAEVWASSNVQEVSIWLHFPDHMLHLISTWKKKLMPRNGCLEMAHVDFWKEVLGTFGVKAGSMSPPASSPWTVAMAAAAGGWGGNYPWASPCYMASALLHLALPAL